MTKSFAQSKGARAERSVIKLLQPVVDEIWNEMHSGDEPAPVLQRNTIQSDRGGFDIVGLNWIALEIKHQETLNVNVWWEQTVRQAKNNQEPVLIYKQNNIKFRVKLWATIGIHSSGGKTQNHIVEISMDSFLEYFRARMRAEMVLKEY